MYVCRPLGQRAADLAQVNGQMAVAFQEYDRAFGVGWQLFTWPILALKVGIGYAGHYEQRIWLATIEEIMQARVNQTAAAASGKPRLQAVVAVVASPLPMNKIVIVPDLPAHHRDTSADGVTRSAKALTWAIGGASYRAGDGLNGGHFQGAQRKYVGRQYEL